jgi:uncharacterized damage-inducible protein DinB
MTSRIEHIRLLAEYNEWMNAKLYSTAMRLTDTELSINRKAFFGSILGTLNHLVVGDTLWLKRFATHPAQYTQLDFLKEISLPTRLDEILFEDIYSLSNHRIMLDQNIRAWAGTISEQDLDHGLAYTTMEGKAAKRKFYTLLINLFNHQTHHRGQTTTLLTQANVDVGVTDLLAIVPNEIEI